MTAPKLVILVFAFGAAACGSTPNPADRVRSTEVKALECIGSVALIKASKIEAKAAAGIPDDWRDRVKRARIVVRGKTATLAPGPTGHTARFVLRDGRWLAQNS
jgi:hypothetical protein